MIRRSFVAAVACLFTPSVVGIQTCGECAGATVRAGGAEAARYAPVDLPTFSGDAGAVRRVTTYLLVAGDVVEEDSAGHVVAVRHATRPPTWTRFRPGAVSPRGRAVVVGELDVP